MSDFYIGLISGTSADGIDAALVDFGGERPAIVATHYIPYSDSLRAKIFALCQKGEDEIARLGELDVSLGKEFAQAANHLLKAESIAPHHIKAIGSHGQSIRHYPHHQFTLQIGDPNIIAAETGITTIADFRRKDIAYGGQGAPLVPAFHHYLFADDKKDRIIVNIGGIANITFLTPKQPNVITGFDTGPGNTLMNAWIFAQQKKSHDENGAWAKQGRTEQTLLENLCADAYFSLPSPKSTGPEYFNLAWLENHLQHFKNLAAVDVEATLLELTAQTIVTAIRKLTTSGEILVCGGGAHNGYLMERLQALAAPLTVASTEMQGFHPDWIEAAAFAWLAKRTLHRQPGNLPSVTGAKQAAVLGGIYYAS